MVENKFDATNFDLFDVEELEGRFEMRAWIRIYEPCDCDGDGCCIKRRKVDSEIRRKVNS